METKNGTPSPGMFAVAMEGKDEVALWRFRRCVLESVDGKDLHIRPRPQQVFVELAGETLRVALHPAPRLLLASRKYWMVVGAGLMASLTGLLRLVASF